MAERRIEMQHAQIVKALRQQAARMHQAADALAGKKRPVDSVRTVEQRRNISNGLKKSWARRKRMAV